MKDSLLGYNNAKKENSLGLVLSYLEELIHSNKKTLVIQAILLN